MRGGRAVRAAAAFAAVLGLAACITIYEDGAPEDGAAVPPAYGAYLMVPFDALEDPASAQAFQQTILPALSLDHPVSNTGNEEYPWYCFAYTDMEAAEYGRRQVQAMPGGEAIAPYLLVDTGCAAG